jgi:ribosomal protein S18 acetylase RimI-like enzyme
MKIAEMIEIRKAEINDAPVLAKVHVDSWRVTYKGIIPESHYEIFTYQNKELTWSERLSKQTEEIYIAEEDRQPVGILSIGPGRDEDLDQNIAGEIKTIYILPEHWRHGIGTILVKKAEKEFRNHGYKEIMVWVLAENTRARIFYEKRGYEPDGKEKTLLLGKELLAFRYHKRNKNP